MVDNKVNNTETTDSKDKTGTDKTGTDKKKYKYGKCPHCGTRSRKDLATIYVMLPNGTNLGIPDTEVFVCKKCEGLRVSSKETEKLREISAEFYKEMTKKLDSGEIAIADETDKLPEDAVSLKDYLGGSDNIIE